VLDVSRWLCYKSYRRSIEHPFEGQAPTGLSHRSTRSESSGRNVRKKGTTMAIAAPFPAARATRTPSRPVRSRAAAPTRPIRPASASAGLRLTRRGRVVLGVVSTVFLLLVVLFSGRLSADAGTSLSDQGRATGVVVVQAGESLWQIAQAIAPQADPRETVTLIRELNGLGEAAVMPGQSIVVPVVGMSGA
jgi:nucleoid-associated protein YgaU